MADAMVACHGALSVPAALSGMAAALGRELIAPALPAHPGGPAWDVSRDYHDQAYEALQAVAPEGPFDLFGHSLGGTVALRFALNHGDRVRSLTVFEPVLFAAASAEAQQTHFEEIAEFQSEMAQGNHAAAAEAFNGYWGTGAPWGTLPTRARAMITRLIPIIPATEPAIVDDIHQMVPALSSCPVPTLILRHVQSPAIVHAINGALGTALTNTSTQVLSGQGGHMLPVTDPTVVADAMMQFAPYASPKSASS